MPISRSHHLDQFAPHLIPIINRQEREFFTTQDLASDRGGLLPYKEQTLIQWRGLGKGPAWFETESGSIFYAKFAVIEWLEECAARGALGQARRRRRYTEVERLKHLAEELGLPLRHFTRNAPFPPGTDPNCPNEVYSIWFGGQLLKKHLECREPTVVSLLQAAE